LVEWILPAALGIRSSRFACVVVARKLINWIWLYGDVDLVGRKWPRVEKLLRPGGGGAQDVGAIEEIESAK
jgi:hypothetical protein